MFTSVVWDIIFRASSLDKKLERIGPQGLKWQIAWCLESFLLVYFFQCVHSDKGNKLWFYVIVHNSGYTPLSLVSSCLLLRANLWLCESSAQFYIIVTLHTVSKVLMLSLKQASQDPWLACFHLLCIKMQMWQLMSVINLHKRKKTFAPKVIFNTTNV